MAAAVNNHKANVEALKKDADGVRNQELTKSRKELDEASKANAGGRITVITNFILPRNQVSTQGGPLRP